jgi:hypothetical protein
MIEAFRVRNGSREWRQLPPGFRPLAGDEKIQSGDVIKMNPEWFSEYKSGTLIGNTPSHSGWFRFDPALLSAGVQEPIDPATILADANALARKISMTMGHTAADGHRFDLGQSAWETSAWKSAVEAYEMIKGLDVLSAVSDLLLLDAARNGVPEKLNS